MQTSGSSVNASSTLLFAGRATVFLHPILDTHVITVIYPRRTSRTFVCAGGGGGTAAKLRFALAGIGTNMIFNPIVVR